MSGLLAAGVSCRWNHNARASGASVHPVRHWWVTVDRMLHWSDEAGSDHARVPIPGADPVLLVDAWRRTVIHPNGTTRWLDTAGGSPRWRPGFALMEDTMKGYVGACWASCSAGVAWDLERRLWTWQRDSMAPAVLLSPHPVPGEAPILSVSIGPPTVAVLADGSRVLLSGAWMPLPSVGGESGGEPGTVRVRVLRGFSDGSRALSPGDMVELPEAEGMALHAQGRVELVVGVSSDD